MTRRLRRKTRPLSINSYIHRATKGLPRAERLDTATELRQHLMERVTEYEQQGYLREEAEFLAVQGMGEPQVTNRELLGHFFTNRAGWLILLALLLAIGSMTYYRKAQWDGLRLAHRIPLDDTALSQVPARYWPQLGGMNDTFREQAEIRFPQGTQYVYAAFLSHDSKLLKPAFAFPVGIRASGSSNTDITPQFTPADAERYWQSRFRLLSLFGPNVTGEKRCPEGQWQVGNLLYGINIKYPHQPGMRWKNTLGSGAIADLSGGFCLDNNSNRAKLLPGQLPLNTWTSVMYVPAGPEGSKATMALLLYPSSTRTIPSRKPEEAYQYDAGRALWVRR